MGWPKGKPRPPGAGRKKGTPNKVVLGIQAKLDAFDNGAGFDPIAEILNLYTLIHADNPLVAVKILTELMQYIYPKRKALEHTIDGHITIEPLPVMEILKDDETRTMAFHLIRKMHELKRIG
jgi:hypothetical protein